MSKKKTPTSTYNTCSTSSALVYSQCKSAFVTTDNPQISISLVKHEATFQTHCYSMDTQANPLKTLSYYTYSYYKPLIMSSTHKTTV